MTSKKHGPAHRRKVFRHGLLRAGAIAGALVAISLLVGVLGYHHFAALGWIDSFYSAAMILGGMGPTEPLPSTRPRSSPGSTRSTRASSSSRAPPCSSPPS